MKKSPDSYVSILKLALPLIGTSMTFSLMMFLNRIFLGMHSLQHLGASGSAGWVSFSIGSFAFGIIGYVSTMTSNYVGAKKWQTLTSAMWQGIYFAMVMSIIILITIMPFAKNIFIYFDHDIDLIPLEAHYLQLLLCTTMINFFSTALSGFLMGNKKTLQVMIANTSAILVNISLDYWLILGGMGIPALGIYGAGLATIGGAITSVSISFYFCQRLCKTLDIKFFCAYNKAESQTLLRFGTPVSLQLTLASLGPSFLSLIIGKLGSMMLLGYTIFGSVLGMFYMPFYGISAAMSILVGQSAGGHQFFRLSPLLQKTIIICLLYFLILTPLFIFGHASLVQLFVNDAHLEQIPQIIETTRGLFMILSLVMAVQAIQGIWIQFFKALGDTRFIFIIYALALGLIWVLPTWITLQFWSSLWAIMIPMMIFYLTVAGVCLLRYRSQKWMQALVVAKK
ncbi:MAG: MATE family efflux transporter [Spirochaetia bacterium]